MRISHDHSPTCPECGWVCMDPVHLRSTRSLITCRGDCGKKFWWDNPKVTADDDTTTVDTAPRSALDSQVADPERCLAVGMRVLIDATGWDGLGAAPATGMGTIMHAGISHDIWKVKVDGHPNTHSPPDGPWAYWAYETQHLTPVDASGIPHASPQPQSALDSQVAGGHYKDFAIQPCEFITRNNLGYIEGNIIKYACRHGAKNGAEDVRKIIHYAELLLEIRYPEDRV